MAKPQLEKKDLQDPASVVGRVFMAYGACTFPELAQRAGVGLSTAKNWHYRGSVPLEHLVQAAADTKRSLDWLATGRESLSVAGAGSKSNHPGRLSTGAGLPGGLELNVQEEGPSWRVAPVRPVKAEGPELSAPAGAGIRRGAKTALLPASGASQARPLVLTLIHQQAGRRVDYQVIPEVMGGAAAGRAGSAPATDLHFDRAGELAMSFEWLHRNLSHTTGELASVRVMGDSMSPTLLDGDTIVIDLGVREVNVDAIYVVHMLGQRLVKRMQRKLDGGLVVISDNQAYEREAIPAGRVREIEVIGRMVWPRVR